MKSIYIMLLLLVLILPVNAEQLCGLIQKTDRPGWIPAHAYTNDSMIGEYRSLLPWKNGKPLAPQGEDMRLLKSAAHYWLGPVPPMCMIHCVPVPGQPGNFSFYTINGVAGPKGWLQDIGTTGEHGGRNYRYWFDQ